MPKKKSEPIWPKETYGELDTWEPWCMAQLDAEQVRLSDETQDLLDGIEKKYWEAISELGLAHEAEIAVRVTQADKLLDRLVHS